MITRKLLCFLITSILYLCLHLCSLHSLFLMSAHRGKFRDFSSVWIQFSMEVAHETQTWSVCGWIGLCINVFHFVAYIGSIIFLHCIQLLSESQVVWTVNIIIEILYRLILFLFINDIVLLLFYQKMNKNNKSLIKEFVKLGAQNLQSETCTGWLWCWQFVFYLIKCM